MGVVLRSERSSVERLTAAEPQGKLADLEQRRVLLIAGDANVVARCVEVIGARGWSSDVVAERSLGYSLLIERPYDLVLVEREVQRPDGQQIAFSRTAREAGCIAAIVILARSFTVAFRLDSSRAGADGCVALGQCDDHELCLRFEDAILWAGARWHHGPATLVRLGRIVVNLMTQSILLDGLPLQLTPVERKLLVSLGYRVGSVVSAKELCALAGIQPDPAHRNLGNSIRRLRRRLGATHADLIQNVRGSGYLLRGSVGQNCIQE